MKILKNILTGKVFFFSISFFFVLGTFYPNFMVVKNIVHEIENKYIKEAENIGLYEPEFVYSSNKEFIEKLETCINYLNFKLHQYERIPKELVIAQAVLESNYGKSRFAIEGNNLFGIRTWDLESPHIKPFDTKDQTFGIKVFKTKCSCVSYYIYILNNNSAFSEFRIQRKKMLDNKRMNVLHLVDYISKFATDTEYVSKVKRTIVELRKL
tara:strand:+ start:5312 stop:5944 length:633 start_codon:yes stop_codon:yes gene_type:complete